MRLIKSLITTAIAIVVTLTLTGCGSSRFAQESWVLPKKKSDELGMIAGRIDHPVDKKLNPKGRVVYLSFVEFRQKEEKYLLLPTSMEATILDNNYFVLPNIKPGKYFLAGFQTGKILNSLPEENSYVVDVKPGEIAFYGSIDYIITQRSGFFRSGEFSLRRAAKPTERDMLEWLYKHSAGSGWEASIRQQLGQKGN